ncbi:MAG TPA: NAD(P)-dependent oxidoreductase [Rhodopila sp.]|uniref:NAD(P)-dependent oxidoreductase n=1 Tax=Rhodopila sp. TaxID=2480087 RepID=UPI002BE6CE6C|nr:NAD(P)-dependent oxidoreductase [Rhodopila sp.]HVY17318.1 NAD(P)-dependent oxidoreductase [Rhodopila sp.]
MHIGYLGVGNMGQPMAGKLLDGGHQLTLLDINEANMAPLLARQARRTDSPKALADAAETVVVSLPTLGAFRHVVFGEDGLLKGRAMKTLINTCTVGVPFVRELEAALRAIGCTLVDCPISGGPAGAAAGTLSVMVSGDPKTVESVRPLISLWGPTVTVAGDAPGAAQVLKLTNNILFAVSLVATSEAFVMGAKYGLDPKVMLDSIAAGTGANGATRSVFPRAVLPRTFQFGATLDILIKDVDLAIEQGEELGVPMWVCQAARLVLKHAGMAGKGGDDLSTLVKVIEDGAQFQLPRSV